VLAVAAYLIAEKTDAPASPIFGELMSQHGIQDVVNDHCHFVQRTYERFQRTLSVADRDRMGRPANIPPDLVRACTDILAEGHQYMGTQWWFASVEEASQISPRMAGVLGQAGCTPEQMWTAIKKADSTLVRKTLEIKVPLSPEVRAARQEAAIRGESLTQEDLERMVFIDEKTIEVQPCTSIKVICPRGTKLPIFEDQRLSKRRKRDKLVIKGIYAVNSIIGAVLWRPLSGTTDYKSGYTVSHVRCHYKRIFLPRSLGPITPNLQPHLAFVTPTKLNEWSVCVCLCPQKKGFQDTTWGRSI
jgi:hypothetical protein